MRIVLTAAPVLAGCLLVSCTSRAPFRAFDLPEGATCVSVAGHMADEELEPQLRFGAAEAVLERGGRYFEVAARTTTSHPSPAPGVRDVNQIAYKDGVYCFRIVPGGVEGTNALDAVRIVKEADPALRKGLSAGARRAFEAAAADGKTGGIASR
jgi:hypothetical protein